MSKKRLITELTVKIWPNGIGHDEMADHLEHVVLMLRQGYVAGEVCPDNGRGWWDTKK